MYCKRGNGAFVLDLSEKETEADLRWSPTGFIVQTHDDTSVRA